MYAFNNILIFLGSIQFFFLNATIDECIRLQTNYMNETDSIQMNTRLDDSLCNQGNKRDSIHAYAY